MSGARIFLRHMRELIDMYLNVMVMMLMMMVMVMDMVMMSVAVMMMMVVVVVVIMKTMTRAERHTCIFHSLKIIAGPMAGCARRKRVHWAEEGGRFKHYRFQKPAKYSKYSE